MKEILDLHGKTEQQEMKLSWEQKLDIEAEAEKYANEHSNKGSDLNTGMFMGYSAALLNHTPKEEKEEWISVESGLPDINESVLVEAFYLKCGKPVSEIFVGYMDEYGDLYSMPTDEIFGWQFNDVVVRWRKLPTPPKEAEQKTIKHEIRIRSQLCSLCHIPALRRMG